MKPRTVAAGEFKTHCLRFLDEVNRKHTSLTITKRGKAVAKLIPVIDKQPFSLYGCLKNTVVICDDIISPTGETWEADSDG